MDLTAPSFQSIREEIIGYLKESDEFMDYNFEGSTFSVIIDALAYTMLQMKYYANYATVESFLESATQRANVVSHARILGYVPAQEQAATAKVKLKYIGVNKNVIRQSPLLEAGYKFIGTNDIGSFDFITEQDVYFKEENGTFTATLPLVNGRWVTETFTQNSTLTTECILNNPCVTGTMKVIWVENSTSMDEHVMELATDISDFSPEADLYYIQESRNGKLEIYFGDGVMSRMFKANNKVTVTYLSCDAGDANNITSFAMSSDIKGLSPSFFTIELINASSGGGDKESIESIKFNAPRWYQRQDRNVTVNDYTNNIKSKYGTIIKSMAVWGGEDNNPPDYGSVYVSILPNTGVNLSDKFKETVRKEIQSKCLPCIVTKVVEANVVYVDINISCDFWENQSVRMCEDIRGMIETTAINFFEESFSGFRAYYRDAKLINAIYDLDEKLEDVIITKTIWQYLNVYNIAGQYYSVSFNNYIEPGSLSIGPWTSETGAELEILDDGVGNIYEYNNTYNTKGLNIGTIDYNTGLISINSYDFKVTRSIQLTVTVKPLTSNIQMRNNYIMLLNNLEINVNNLSLENY